MLRMVRSITGAVVLAGLMSACVLVEGDGRHLQPLSQSAKARLSQMGSSPGAPMMVRIIKDESALEVWKKTSGGAFKLFKTYEICNWSGELGPKIREGDRQSPEGFYTITPGRMNPKSNYYLSFDTGFPNKFDRAHGRSGSNLMVHGDCSSRGCYAMTDPQIAEIYALGRESFIGGQRSFALEVFPFRMTAANLALHKDSPHLAFWRNLKTGYDHFEISKRPPDWDVCNKNYVFNVSSASGRPLDANAPCPELKTADRALLAQVEARQGADQAAFVTAVAKAEDAEIKKVADAAAAAEAKAAAAARGEAISTAVTGFFGQLFGGGREPAATEVPKVAPVPFPRIDRG